MTPLLIALGAAIGAPTRYLTDRLIQSHHDSVFPWGTFSVNVVGSLILGVIVGLPAAAGMTALVGIGFCGALTTYSTVGYETFRLAQERALVLAVLNVGVSLSAGLGAAVVGVTIGQAFTR